MGWVVSVKVGEGSILKQRMCVYVCVLFVCLCVCVCMCVCECALDV